MASASRKAVLAAIAGLLGLQLAACGSSGADRYWEQQRAAWTRYWQEYSSLRTSDLGVLMNQLQAVRGDQLVPRQPGMPLSEAEAGAEWADASLQELVQHPERIAALDLIAPRRFPPDTDISAHLGSWRCEAGLQTSRLNISTAPAPFEWPRGPSIPCTTLKRALVIREGTAQGDWLFYLPDQSDCRWLYVHTEFAAQCTDSLKEWLAASIVGARSRVARLTADEKAVTALMREQRALDLRASVAELRQFTPDQEMDQPPTLPDTERAPAIADYPAAMEQLGEMRPAAFLPVNETRLTQYQSAEYGGSGKGYNSDTAIVRLWRDGQFATIRLRPQDYARAVIVVAQQRVGPLVLQLPLPEGGVLYVHLQQRRAFLSFKEWVDYARAQERAWKSHPPAAPGAVANMPFG